MRTRLFERILCAMDMSDNAAEAANYALRLALNCNAHLDIVNVIPSRVEEMSANMGYDLAVHYDSNSLEAFNKKDIEQRRNILTNRIQTICDEIRSQLNDCPVPPKISIRTGHTVEQIMLEAKKEESDLIVVGTREHNVLDNILIGSVARGVMKESDVPVVTIPL